ncbi:hypothetical protein BN1058_00019 [Paraliobacillus sp. PM-2]|uniref:DUF1129 family protein n=1 Tax=Paraliobacillus sp. PM-2 TaxID=1462524 RepID=UPI00061BBF00|nr:DUF1129 family protein [Paraliobacillus sp. PM-2]CQR45783.1 hypothetical protein BN1058_00019 [Paraliobacillus sp. PM-2]
MEAIIQANNQKRKLLNEKNKKIYEDMLMYIRLSYDKSEEETEEILMELLDHLFILQEEGKDAEELFGEDPQRYADEIINELPKTVSKKRLLLFGMGVSYFFAVSAMFQGLLSIILFYVFNQSEISQTYSVGTVLVNTCLSLGVAALVLYGIIRYLRWSCFKQVSKVFEFVFTGILFGVLPFCLFMFIFYFMPSFGPTITFDVYWFIPIGIVLFFMGQKLRKQV